MPSEDDQREKYVGFMGKGIKLVGILCSKDEAGLG